MLADVKGIGEDIVPLSRWRCTMAQALAHALPGSLDRLGQVLGLSQDQAKIKAGKALIKLFCQPATGNGNVDRNTPHTHPEQWQQFREYAIRDVETLRMIAGLLPDWNWGDQEVALWHLDQVINDRGFQVDMDLIRAGAKASEQEKQQLAERFTRLTEGAVGRPTQRQKLRTWLQDRYSLTLPDTQAATLQRAIADNQTPASVREILQLVQQANKTSTAKYAALHQAVSADGRFRGGLQFNGASRTRRWSGRTFQPQNLPSRGLPEQAAIERYIDALKRGDYRQASVDPMRYASAALRGVLVAPKGRKLVVADLANIEGRMLAWLAGERWKLDAFAGFDRGEGSDLYRITAGHILGVPAANVSKAQRDVMGKVPELALGYEGGAGAFRQFSQGYGIDMAQYWPKIQQGLAPRFVRQAKGHWD